MGNRTHLGARQPSQRGGAHERDRRLL